MSEVIGYLLVFGILSVVLVLSMSAFTVAQDAARTRVVAVRADSAAARVAGVVVQTAVLWEQQHTATSDTAVAYLVDLPDQLEGRDYRVRLIAASGSSPDRVEVCVPLCTTTHAPEGSAPVFSAAAPPGLDICDGSTSGTGVGYTEARGGPLYVRINAPADGASRPLPSGVCTTNELFLETA